MKLFFAIAFFVPQSIPFFVLAGDPPARCEQTLVHFISQRHEVPSETIGLSETCDDFGGNLVYTPKNHVRLFVNFNIVGTINLDLVDRALDDAAKLGAFPLVRVRRMPVSIVEDGWIAQTYGSDREVSMGFGQDSLFVTAKVVTEGRLEILLREFYAQAAPLYR